MDQDLNKTFAAHIQRLKNRKIEVLGQAAGYLNK